MNTERVNYFVQRGAAWRPCCSVCESEDVEPVRECSAGHSIAIVCQSCGAAWEGAEIIGTRKG